MVRTSNSRSKTSEAPARGSAGAGARAGGARRVRGPSADRRWQERQRAILRAAAAVFREKGFEAAGMRDIAEAAGLSAANLYYYYGSKDELLYTCQDQALERMLDAVRGARTVRSGARPVAERLRGVIEAQLRCMLEELEGGAAHLAVDALPPRLRARIVDKRDRYERALRALVAEGVRAGEFAPCDPTLVTRAMLGALNWTAQWYRQGGRTPLDALCAGFSDYLVRGLRA
jgi:AcrR family transcriptional regulator